MGRLLWVREREIRALCDHDGFEKGISMDGLGVDLLPLETRTDHLQLPKIFGLSSSRSALAILAEGERPGLYMHSSVQNDRGNLVLLHV